MRHAPRSALVRRARRSGRLDQQPALASIGSTAGSRPRKARYAARRIERVAGRVDVAQQPRARPSGSKTSPASTKASTARRRRAPRPTGRRSSRRRSRCRRTGGRSAAAGGASRSRAACRCARALRASNAAMSTPPDPLTRAAPCRAARRRRTAPSAKPWLKRWRPSAARSISSSRHRRAGVGVARVALSTSGSKAQCSNSCDGSSTKSRSTWVPDRRP